MSATPTVEDLRKQLASLGLDSRGNKADLRNRLHKARKRQQQQQDGDGPDGAGEGNTPGFSPQHHTFLVLDVEATCESTRKYGINHKRNTSWSFRSDVGSNQYPNEIIEFPVVVLRWNRHTCSLDILDVFHRFVCPTFRPRLSQFCKDLTGIQQAQVLASPTWDKVVRELHQFLLIHNLIEARAGNPNDFHGYRLRRGVAWVTHGPCDLRDFVIKQSWICPTGQRSELGTPPVFLRGPLIDVRKSIQDLHTWEQDILAEASRSSSSRSSPFPQFGGDDGFQIISPPKPSPTSHGTGQAVEGLSKRDSTVPGLLDLLGIGPFQGKQHSGLADTRNISRLVIELARRIYETSLGNQILLQKGLESVDGEIQKLESSLTLEPARAMRRAKELEALVLFPNIRTDNYRKQWIWMTRTPGLVSWPFLAEDNQGSAHPGIVKSSTTLDSTHTSSSSASSSAPLAA
ncbi:hypothetical protein BCV70DRAFT_202724 [Testicularia cyperi]|uniref:SAP domain-containing protein n=1 Tax=Testicularia cyperi TaxID=1882483 RepID=A0A317XIB3_9BASI|nr:hypothetical protein BCV70DRAFT_202724 [Testicularia cyperi]